MILDVGCGTDPRGNVNIDFFEGACYDDVVKALPPGITLLNPIKASAEDLPIRDKIFKLAVSFAVLEHVESPVQMVREMARVAQRVRVSTPNALFIDKVCRGAIRGKYKPYWGHIYTWGSPELVNLFAYCGLTVTSVKHTNPREGWHRRTPLKYRLVRIIAPGMLRGRSIVVEGFSCRES